MSSTLPLPCHMQGKETGLDIIAYSGPTHFGPLKKRIHGQGQCFSINISLLGAEMCSRPPQNICYIAVSLLRYADAQCGHQRESMLCSGVIAAMCERRATSSSKVV